MNQLSLNPIDRNVIDPAVRRHSGVERASFRRGARGPARRARGPLVCHWRRDPATGALLCVWAVSHGAREPASPVPLRRAS